MHFGMHVLYCLDVVTLENFLNGLHSVFELMELYAENYSRHYITNKMTWNKVFLTMNLCYSGNAMLCFMIYFALL